MMLLSGDLLTIWWKNTTAQSESGEMRQLFTTITRSLWKLLCTRSRPNCKLKVL